jgi:hypothetical protein
MVEFKEDKVRVRCLECDDWFDITLKHFKTYKEQRSVSFEYEHIFRGELKCPVCEEIMKINITVFEYPKGIINCVNCEGVSCLILDDINENSFKIV